MEKSNHEIDELLKDVPEALQPHIAQEQVNQSLVIYKGVYHLIFDQEEVEVDGEIYYSWKPENSIKFKGSCNEWFFPQAASQIRIEGVDISHQGLSFVTGSGSGDAPLKGIINSPFVIQHQKNGAVSTVSFELANFRDVIGLPIKTTTHSSLARIQFDNTTWTVILDKRENFNEIKKELLKEGGYGLMYTGQLTSKKGKLPYAGFQDVISVLSLFLTFLNGRRAYPSFIRGIDGEDVVWTDYSARFVDRFKQSSSWLPQSKLDGLSNLWNNFLKLTSDTQGRECIDYLIHWYLEANNNSGFAEGAIVLLQNSIELLFNWQLVEVLQVYSKSVGKKKKAAEKFRILLNRANIPTGMPAKYANIENKLRQHISFSDFPDLFTQFRNAITHNDSTKRSFMDHIDSMARFHIKEIGVAYVELLLLHLFGYDGPFANRLSENMFVGGNEEIVPWNN